MPVIKLKNTSGSEDVWCGTVIPNGEYYEIQSPIERCKFAHDTKVLTDIDNEDLVVNIDGVDITDPDQGKADLECYEKRIIVVSLFTDIKPFKETEATDPDTLATLPFGGYSNFGKPANIYAAYQMYGDCDENNYGRLRIYDLHNNNTIVSKNNITDEDITLRSLGSLNNISSDQALWAIQGSIVGSDIKIRVASILISW